MSTHVRKLHDFSQIWKKTTVVTMAGKSTDRPKKEPDTDSQMVEPDSSTNSTTSNPTDQGSRSSNIQRILMRKDRVSTTHCISK